MIAFLWYDAIRGLFYNGSFGIGVGNAIMFINVICLSAFTFGCNSWRHIIGGKLNCFSCTTAAQTRHTAWKKVSILNGKPHAVGLDQHVHRLGDRPLHLAGLLRRVQRPAPHLLMAIEHHDYDVLVLGSGGSGLRAAIAAAEAGAKTGLVCKSLLGKAHTVMAEGGLAASLGNVAPEDNWSTHFQDTMFGGKYLNNWRMAELHAKEAPDRARELEHWGAVFDRTPERVMSQRAFGGHTYKRLVHIGDRTGLEMIRTLQDKTVHSDVEVFMETTITRLIKDGERVVGAFGYRRATGEQISFSAKALVIATGGSGRIYKITSNSQDCTGDGYALGYEAGAELVDMEFIQFHPTGMVYPPGVAGLLVTEAVRGEGGILRNNEGERFMERYDPKRMELSTRDVVARSIYTEVKEGRGSPHGGVFLDVSHLDSDYVKTQAPEHVRPVHGAGRRRHHQGADAGRADLPLLHGRRQGRRRQRASRACQGCSQPVRRAAA